MSAFAKLSAMDPELHLVMAGPDEQGWRRQLTQRAEDLGCEERVHWPGMLQREVKWGAFQACEAFILASHQENFGIAVAEAMACGKPVLLSNKVNIAEEIQQDGAGYMEPDTADGTESLLLRWFGTSPVERAAMSAQAAASFKKRYDMRENAKTIIGLFKLAIAQQGSVKSAPVLEAR